jgi:DNA invertase Pin-like site-specific DNA recombinase
MARKSRKAENAAVAPETREAVWNTALYARLSVMDSGKKDGESILNQQEMLKSYVLEHPELLEKGVYVDNGETGVDFLRPAWSDMMSAVKSGKINCLVVKDLSRVGRSYLEVGEYLEKIFPALGVRVIAINDGYDSLTLTNGGRLVSNLKNLVNDIYAKDISRKSSAALRIKQKQGLHCCAFAAYGYRKDPENKNRLLINPDTAPTVRRIFEMKAAGVGDAQICRRLEEMGLPSPGRYRFLQGTGKGKDYGESRWNPRTLGQILRNISYLGHMTQGAWNGALYEGVGKHERNGDQAIVVPNTHEAIVTQELFDKANAVVAERKAQYKDKLGKNDHFEKPEFILQGLVFCADCGKSLQRSKMVYVNGKTAVWRYTCRTFETHRACSKKHINEADLNGAVYEAIRNEIEKCADIGGIIEKLNRESGHKSRLMRFDAEIEEAEREIKRVASLRQAVYEDYATKLLTLSEYQFAVEKYNADTERLKLRLELAKREKAEYTQNSTPTNKWLTAFRRFADEKELTAGMAQALIERVEVYERNRVCVTFKFRDEYAAIAQHAEVL